MQLTQALQHPIFTIVAQAAKNLQVETYVIGGFVRDYLLQRDYKKDIDFVAVGNGIDLALEVSQLLPGKPKVQVFKNFGTAMLRFQDMDFEFVGARKESYDRNSRKPFVENGTLKEDQDRRDFTINALAISLNETNYGGLMDPFNGQEDLKNQTTFHKYSKE
jgi:tRNA nucleotidyltransferase (CCA-adding enzyme)